MCSCLVRKKNRTKRFCLYSGAGSLSAFTPGSRRHGSILYIFTLSVCDLPPFPYTLQVTVFMALLVLDSKRLQQSRLDCLPCIRVPYRDASGHWVYDDVSDNEEDEQSALQNPGLSGRSWGLPGFGGRLGAAAAQQGAGSSGVDPGEMYYAPMQEVPPVAAAPAPSAAADANTAAAAAAGRGHGHGNAGQRAAPGPMSPGPSVLPGVTKAGPGLLHGDKISLQSLLQVGCSDGPDMWCARQNAPLYCGELTRPYKRCCSCLLLLLHVHMPRPLRVMPDCCASGFSTAQGSILSLVGLSIYAYALFAAASCLFFPAMCDACCAPQRLCACAAEPTHVPWLLFPLLLLLLPRPTWNVSMLRC